MSSKEKDAIRDQVRAHYAAAAQRGAACCQRSGCCGSSGRETGYARRLGYSEEDTTLAPAGSEMGLGCGNPQVLAQLRPGEVVLDLGCGGGFDCFLAARKVGEKGQVIGVDMTPQMLAQARENASRSGLAHVSFRLGEIEHLPLGDQSVDVVISNCVINLSPDKAQVFREVYRVLRPGGRLAIADVVAIAPIPEEIQLDEAALCGCVGGAAPAEALRKMLLEAGLSQIAITVKPESEALIRDWFPQGGVEAYVRSALITARKKEA